MLYGVAGHSRHRLPAAALLPACCAVCRTHFALSRVAHAGARALPTHASLRTGLRYARTHFAGVAARPMHFAPHRTTRLPLILLSLAGGELPSGCPRIHSDPFSLGRTDNAQWTDAMVCANRGHRTVARPRALPALTRRARPHTAYAHAMLCDYLPVARSSHSSPACLPVVLQTLHSAPLAAYLLPTTARKRDDAFTGRYRFRLARLCSDARTAWRDIRTILHAFLGSLFSTLVCCFT